MRLLVLLTTISLFFASCTTNYEVKDLYGKWSGESMGFTFNEDSSCEIILNGEKYPGDTHWRAAIGNTLEFTANGKVIMANVTIKSLKDKVLTIEMRPMTTSKDVTTIIHEMKRVEE